MAVQGATLSGVQVLSAVGSRRGGVQSTLGAAKTEEVMADLVNRVANYRPAGCPIASRISPGDDLTGAGGGTPTVVPGLGMLGWAIDLYPDTPCELECWDQAVASVGSLGSYVVGGLVVGAVVAGGVGSALTVEVGGWGALMFPLGGALGSGAGLGLWTGQVLRAYADCRAQNCGESQSSAGSEGQ